MNNLNHKHLIINGLKWRDCAFFLPMDWYQFALANNDRGEIYDSDPNDPTTSLTITLNNFKISSTPHNWAVLVTGFLEHVEAKFARDVEARNQKVTGKQLQLEAKYTYREEDATRKCWQHLFYHGNQHIEHTAQGQPT